MFRIVCDRSIIREYRLYLTEIHSGSLMFVVCLVGVWQHNFEPVVCVYGTTSWELVPSLSSGMQGGFSFHPAYQTVIYTE